MTRPIPLDPSAPLRSLRLASGLTQAALAEARGVRQPSQAEAEGLGPRVRLATLLAAAEAAGLEILLAARKIAPPKKDP